MQTAYERFVLHLRMIIYQSLNEDNQEDLRNALTCILQEEAQDRHWEKLRAEERPPWRPMRCKKIHDSLLQTVVEERMKKADEQENGTDKLSTSLKREVCRMGKQVQNDLLRVVRRLRECYPPDFDICRTYALLYHHAFSTKLQELARSKIDFEDCHYILSWVVKFYPRYAAIYKLYRFCIILLYFSLVERRTLNGFSFSTLVVYNSYLFHFYVYEVYNLIHKH